MCERSQTAIWVPPCPDSILNHSEAAGDQPWQEMKQESCKESQRTNNYIKISLNFIAVNEYQPAPMPAYGPHPFPDSVWDCSEVAGGQPWLQNLPRKLRALLAYGYLYQDSQKFTPTCWQLAPSIHVPTRSRLRPDNRPKKLPRSLPIGVAGSVASSAAESVLSCAVFSSLAAARAAICLAGGPSPRAHRASGAQGPPGSGRLESPHAKMYI